jgi:hypothetical protein
VRVLIGGAGVLVATLTAVWLAAHGYTTFATPYCSAGATSVTTAATLVDALEAGEDVCVTADIDDDVSVDNVSGVQALGTGDVTAGSATIANVAASEGTFAVGMRVVGAGLSRTSRVTAVEGATVTLSTPAAVGGTAVALSAADDLQVGSDGDGRILNLELGGTAWVTVHARLQALRFDDTEWTWLDNSILGGSEDDPSLLSAVQGLSTSEDTWITNNDIGFTTADNTGDTGYGLRIYGENNRLLVAGNKIHNIGADGIQGIGGSDVLVDRNEIGPVGPPEGSDEHSDAIQLTGNGPNLRITNNWLHHQGYFNGDISGNAGIIYIHGTGPDDADAVLVENNLFEHSRGRFEACGLGTPDPPYFRRNLTIRNNTIRDQGQAFSDFPGFEWDCSDAASLGNVVERNIAVDPDGGVEDHDITTGVTFTDNLFGTEALVTLDDDGNCTSLNCTTAGGDPIGYRKPTGVNW